MREVRQLAHKAGLSIYQYLDDWLGQSHTEREAADEAQLLLRLCLHLGLKVNLEKSDLLPALDFNFLGVGFDLLRGIVKPTEAHITELIQLIDRFLRSDSLPAVRWQSLLGSLVAQEKFVHLGRLHLRPLQWHLAAHWNQVSDPPSYRVPITQEIRPALTWWSDRDHLASGVPLHWPTPSLRIFTDASTQGWGAHCQGSTCQGLWDPPESLLHINVLEMRAVRLALAELQPAASTVILVATDNSTVVAYINKQGGLRSSQLWQETLLLFDLLQLHDLSLRARHIPGRLNVIADQLSRQGQLLPTEWTLHQDLVRLIFNHWSPPLLDLFATRFTTRLPVFVSPVPDPEAWEVDALSISWENLDAYAFPPHVILTSVLRKFRETKSCRLILVAPRVETFSWFPTLQELTVEPPLPLPPTRTMLRQPQSDRFHSYPESLRLHAWLLLKRR
jgi:ribonuclease HI